MTTNTTHITKEALLQRAAYALKEFQSTRHQLTHIGELETLIEDIDDALTRAAELSAQESKPVDDPAYVHAVEKNALLMEHARRAVALGMAAIATYGKRDENGLTGLSKKHWQELSELSLVTLAAPSVSAQDASPKDGWKLVPLEPTQEMLMAGAKAGCSTEVLLDDTPFSCDMACWKAMLATSPEPPTCK